MKALSTAILPWILACSALAYGSAARAQSAPNTVPDASNSDASQSMQNSPDAQNPQNQQASHDSQMSQTSPNAIDGSNPFENLPQGDGVNQPAGQSQSAAQGPPAGTGGDQDPASPQGMWQDPGGFTGATNPDLPDANEIGSAHERASAASTRAIIKSKDDSPMRQALNDLLSGNYTESVTKLNRILDANPRQLQAHYLKAVICVLTRHYRDAEYEYKTILKAEPTSELGRMAAEGLTKLNR